MYLKLSLPDYLRVYFWDIEIDELDLHQHSNFIISRILNEGNDRALKWLFDFYDKETIKNAVKVSRNLSFKTTRCWQNYFDLKEEELCCTGLRLAKNERLY